MGRSGRAAVVEPVSSRRGPRLVFAVGILAGLVYAVGIPQFRPAQVGIATDVYYHAGRAALAGEDVYAVVPPAHPGYRFLYPPVVVLAFLPHALLGDPTLAYVLQTAVNLAAAAGIGLLSVRTVERAGIALDRVDRGLAVAFAVGSILPVANLLMGQVNLPLAFGIAAGAVLVERERDVLGGVTFGLVALVKLYPALVGAWLCRRRAWRAVLAATATGTASLAVGVLLLGPDLTVTYLTDTLPRAAGTGGFTGTPDPATETLTVRRQIAALAPWIPASWRLPTALVLVTPVVLVAYRSVADPVSRLLALEVTLLGTLALFPLEPFYLVLALYPTIPLAYLLSGWPRRLFLVGIVLSSTTVTLTTVRQGVAILGLDGEVGAGILALARHAFAVVLPPTVGVWLLVAGCLLAVRRRIEADEGTVGKP